MKFSRSFVVFVALLALVGSGCGTPSRPILSHPSSTPPAAVSSSTGSGALATDSSDAQAYIALNGGRAMVTRSGESHEVSDEFVLQIGDQIEVTSGTVSLVYPGVGATELEMGTQVSYIEDPTATGFLASLQLEFGRVWTRLDKTLGAGEGFSISANGIVATVRGTGFGVSVADTKDVDVQVAEHQVEVMPTEELSLKPQARKHVLMVGEGDGWSSNHTEMMSGKAMKKLRKLSVKESKEHGFLFAQQAVSPKLMQARPDLKRVKPEKMDATHLKMMEQLRMMKGEQPTMGVQTQVEFVLPPVR